MTQRNSPERKAMLADRAAEQSGRRPSSRAPGFAGRRADINRRTGKPHEHRRQIRRHLRQQAKLVLEGRRPWPSAIVARPSGPYVGNDPPPPATE